MWPREKWEFSQLKKYFFLVISLNHPTNASCGDNLSNTTASYFSFHLIAIVCVMVNFLLNWQKMLKRGHFLLLSGPSLNPRWVQDNSAQNQLSPCQLGPHKNRPMPTRPKIQNSARDNSAQFKFIIRQLVPHFRGIKVCTWKIHPFTLA